LSPFINSVRGTFNTGRFGGGGSWPATTAAAGYQDYTGSGTTTQTYTWTAPAGVWRVSVVAVGGGGGGSYQWSGGGGAGGGLAWANDIKVTPGVAYTVQAGGGGPRIRNTYDNGARGGDSFFRSRLVVCGFGAGSTYYNATAQTSYKGYGGRLNGVSDRSDSYTSLFSQGANDAVGGGYWVGEGYLCNRTTGAHDPTNLAAPTPNQTSWGGGQGGWGAYEGSWTISGAGAGGYTGAGGQRYGADGTRDGFGGAGGRSGTHYSSTYGGVGGGGGVGIQGQGPGVASGGNSSFAGSGGYYGYTPWTGWTSNKDGYGGIGGESASYAPESYGYTGENQWTSTPWPGGQNNIKGADYGGGAGGSGTSSGGGNGGTGAIRITWSPSGRNAQTYPNA